MTQQSLASVIRQMVAVAISAVYTALIALGDQGPFPAWAQAIFVGFGPAILLIEHYLSDPSTGTPVTTPSTTLGATVAPVAPVTAVTVQTPVPVAPLVPPTVPAR